MRPLNVATAVLLGMLACTTASADGVAVAVRAGTPGLGVELTTRLTRNVNVRLGLNTFKAGYSRVQSDIRYDATLSLRSGVGLLDWHPTGGAFRLTSGVVYDKNLVRGVGQSSEGYSIGDTTYLPSDIGTLTVEIPVKKVVPYAGLGLGNAVGRGRRLSFAFDLGVVFQGSPRATLSATGPLGGTPGFREDAEAELRDINDDIARFKYFPVLSIGIGFQF